MGIPFLAQGRQGLRVYAAFHYFLRSIMIPKSLHTVTVLVALTKHLHSAKPDFPIETCLFKALDILGYINAPDIHGLVAQAMKKLTK